MDKERTEALAEATASKTPEWEEEFRKLLKDSYLRGVSRGGKTFVGVIYEIILEDRKKRKNPANTVQRVEAACKRLLGAEAKEPTKNESEES